MGNTAKQCRLGLFQDSDFAGDLEDSKSTSGDVLCIFWKHNTCPSQLDVQETNCCLAHFHRIWTYFSGRWTTYGWVTCSRSLGQPRTISHQHQETGGRTTQSYKLQETGSSSTHMGSLRVENQDPTCHWKTRRWSVEWGGSRTHKHTFVLLKGNLSCTSLKTTKLWSKMIIKGRSPTMRHVSRTHRVALDWLFDRILLVSV